MKIEDIKTELKHKAILATDQPYIFIYNGEKKSIKQIYESLKGDVVHNKKLIKDILAKTIELIKHLIDLDKNQYNYIDDDIFGIFYRSLNNMIFFVKLHGLKEDESIFLSLILKDSNALTSKFMYTLIDYSLSLQWVDHRIYEKLYIMNLLRKYSSLMSSNIKTATDISGVSGPMSNLDLPMEERNYEWEEVEEDLQGASNQKKKGQRYTLGLENYNSYPQEGFVWRETRNDVYKFDDKNENPLLIQNRGGNWTG